MPISRSRTRTLTFTQRLIILRTMRHAFRMAAALRSALAARRDLLLEVVARRHQLGVLTRSDRRFRPADRLLWLCLRQWWPRWKDAVRCENSAEAGLLGNRRIRRNRRKVVGP